MKIKTNYASPLILEDLIISESRFCRTSDVLENIELGINVDREIKKLSDETYEIVLGLTVSDENEQLFVFVKGIGRFRTEQENLGLIEKNTIAIMFPYLRSHISTLTAQPGMTPIVLPAMNIVAMLHDN